MSKQPVIAKRSAVDFLPKTLSLKSLRKAAACCQGCDLYKHATQTVFGEGPRDAEIVLVGEVPGDQEDKQGKPFVGPAGRLLNEALDAIGLDRREVYVTNAVKHFKFEERGKRRMHKQPSRTEVVACRAWLESELAVIKPKLIVCLGATAAQSLLGPQFRITKSRGQVFENPWAPALVATHHPSAVLRAPEKEDRDRMRGELVADLRDAVERVNYVSHRQNTNETA
jgi:uracil-DNA glycosylase family protein